MHLRRNLSCSSLDEVSDGRTRLGSPESAGRSLPILDAQNPSLPAELTLSADAFRKAGGHVFGDTP